MGMEMSLAKPMDNQDLENHGSDNQDSDDHGSDNQDSDDHGSDNQDSNDHGSDNQDSDDHGSDNQDSDEHGSENSDSPPDWDALIKAAFEKHPHCDNCINLHCSASPPICKMETCMLQCGARYHSCKSLEHDLLCANKRIDCINSKYGCPVTMARRSLATHLEKCAACVVVCSVEWGRIPIPWSEAKRVSEEYLDTALAYRDQNHLEEAFFPIEDEKVETMPKLIQVAYCLEAHDGLLKKVRFTRMICDPHPGPLLLRPVIEFGTLYHSSARDKHIFMCEEEMRRDMFTWHFKNVHNDIVCGVNGWLEHHCPMEGFGCMFRQRRLYPDIPEASLTYNRVMECLSVAYETKVLEIKTGVEGDTSKNLCDLPTEVLELIFNFLDPLSLANLSLTCKRMREVCTTIFLPRQGIVSLKWEPGKCSLSKKKHWLITGTIWKFPKFFTPIRKWGFEKNVPMVNHMNTCDYYQRCITMEPYNLTTNASPPPSLLRNAMQEEDANSLKSIEASMAQLDTQYDETCDNQQPPL